LLSERGGGSECRRQDSGARCRLDFGGFGLGILWLKTFPLLPIGANNFDMGFHTMGVVAGQFAFLMTFSFSLFFSTSGL
jgi:hypothetical protein